jgi:Concanavalin A-like lectin/glucanases superfamily/Bacterial Ig-like domain
MVVISSGLVAAAPDARAQAGETSDSYSSEVLADSPSAYWRFGESSGTTAVDETGANPGTYTGGVTLGQPGALQGSLNTSVSLDGVNDYASAPDSDSLDATTGVSIEAWAKRVRSNAFQVIVAKPGNGQSKHENYALWIDSGNFAVAYFGDGSTYVRVSSANPLDTGWHHVVATYDNATAKMYIDGVLTRSVASSVQLNPNTFPLNIGRGRQNGYYLQGQVDEVAVYRTALSAQRIQAHFDVSRTDLTPPVVTLTAPPNGGATNDATPLFSGVAGTAPGDTATVTVKLYSGPTPTGTPLQVLIAGRQGDGSYSVEASGLLAAGTYTAQAEQSDAAGNTGFSSANTFTVDLTAPAVTLAQPADGSTTTDTTPTFTGAGGTAPGDAATVTVKVYSGGDVSGPLVQTLTASISAGTWSVDASSALAEGTYTARAQQGDAAGNIGLSSANTFRVDATAPAVTLTQPANGSTTADTTPTFSGAGGTAQGDASSVTVKVYSGTDVGGPLVQTLTASISGGVWSVDASSALAEGTYTARAQQSDAAGNTGFSSANTFAVSTSEALYRAEVLADNPNSYWRVGEPSGTTATDERGANPATYVGGVLLNQPGAILNDSNRAILLDGVNDYVNAPDSSSLDMTTAVSVETWLKRTKSSAYQIVLAKPGNGQSKFENYAIWLNTSNQLVAYFGNGTTYVSVSAGTIDTNWHHVVATYDNATARIYLDGTLRGSTASSVALTANSLPLNMGRSNDGSYFFGGMLDEIAVYPVALSATRIRAHYDIARGLDSAPPVITLTSPPNGGSTNDPTPALGGVAGTAPGDSATVTVKVYSGPLPSGTPLQTLTTSGQGDGSYIVSAATLAPGTYTAQTEQLDLSGNRGVSSPSTFAVDMTAPAVTLTKPAHGAHTGTRPTFEGVAGAATGDAATVTVEVYVGPAPGGTPVMVLNATRQPNNSYSVTADPLLFEGMYTARTRQNDAAGNTGLSTANTFTVTAGDFEPPAVTLQTPAHGSSTLDTTPTFSGAGGTEPGDLPTITVRVYVGATVDGTLVETLSTTLVGSSWSVDAAPALAEGVYTAQAEQSDEAGNVGQSSANVFTIGASYRDEVLADAPRAYWRLGEATGTTAADQTGANPGTYGGGVTLWQPGVLTADPNTAVSLNGTTGYVTAPDSTSLDLTSGATVEAWVKRSASAQYQVIVGKPGDGQSRNENYALWLIDNLPVAYFGNGSSYAAVYATNPLDTNWHHLVATYNNATARMYVDGVQVATSTSNVHLTANALPLNLGRMNGGTYFFGGQLDEVAVYPTALSAARVQAHFSKANVIDTTAPAVTLTTPENGSTTIDTTPAFAGAAAITGTDSTTVTIKIYSGPTPTGTPVQTLTTTRFASGAWSTSATSALALGTYTAQAEQLDTSGNRGLSAPQTFVIATRPPVGSDPEFVGAGDIAYCDEVGDEATAAVLDQFPSAIVFTLGDNAYESGTLNEFNNCYHPSWGRHKARTRPTLGDHDYADGGNPNATGYMTYFQPQLSPFGPSATDPNRGYYSYDLGSWHVIAVNALCGGAASGCNPATQLSWLQNDLAAHPNSCAVALVSAPRFSSGSVHGNNAGMQAIWDVLAAGGTDLYLSGDDHDYERFAPQDGQGLYQAQGMREIVVGTGGRSHYSFSSTVRANSEVRNDETYGVLRLVLRPSGYEWEFVPEAGRTFTDSGSSSCH